MSRGAPALTRRVRDGAIGIVGSSPAITAAVRRAAGVRARWAGVDPVLTNAIVEEPITLDRALQLMQWCVAVRRGGGFPRHFDPGDHLVTPVARRAALAAIRGREQRDGTVSPTLARALINLDDDRPLDELSMVVAADLRSRMVERSARPHDRRPAEPIVQRELVGSITACLDDAGVRAFLMSGTLLAFHRDQRFIASDYDVDLGLLPGESLERTADHLRAGCDHLVQVDQGRVVVQHESGVTADVFEHVVRDGLWWHSTRIHEWWNTPFDLERREFEGVGVWVPSDPDRYLTENYGRWRTRPSFYDMSFDTPNREYVHDVDALRFLHHRCVRGLATGDRWTVEAAARELRLRFGVDVLDLLADSPLLMARSDDPSS